MLDKPEKANGDVTGFGVGQVVTGPVVHLEHYGAYVRLSLDVVALVLIPEVSRSRIRHPGDAVSIGQVVRAEVLVVDPMRRLVSLSLRRVE